MAPTATSTLTSAIPSAPLPLSTELMLLVFQLVPKTISSRELSADYPLKPAHLANSTTLKPEHVPLVHSPAPNVNSLNLTVPHVVMDKLSAVTDVSPLTLVPQVLTEEPTVNVNNVQLNVPNVSAPLSAPHVPLDTSSTDSTVS